LRKYLIVASPKATVEADESTMWMQMQRQQTVTDKFGSVTSAFKPLH
jgi:hypothetical protein